jgi:anthranilate synthase component 1
MSLEEFKQRAASATLVPIWKDCLLDTDTPVSAFAKIRRGPFAFLLESAPAVKRGRDTLILAPNRAARGAF